MGYIGAMEVSLHQLREAKFVHRCKHHLISPLSRKVEEQCSLRYSLFLQPWYHTQCTMKPWYWPFVLV